MTAPKWEIVQRDGKVYLFAAHTIDEYEATHGHYTDSPIPGRPLSKADMLAIAETMILGANRKGGHR